MNGLCCKIDGWHKIPLVCAAHIPFWLSGVKTRELSGEGHSGQLLSKQLPLVRGPEPCAGRDGYKRERTKQLLPPVSCSLYLH